ncbi:uncharacterized protein EI90DRAFT_1710612 [Cantharellus anzutake]|uniref:uncharacterized protein n=1 Tax=Cantharellus anzutake TaxID=1750568 RepID=UPI001904E8C9|nr:uncharacterized protein EI90DRAFT_1710612 [Cantharellus anzutake]KAF8341268.1 hypothetical protein EI90DRAFT_1710612 [Cantharellus anzutake]
MASHSNTGANSPKSHRHNPSTSSAVSFPPALSQPGGGGGTHMSQSAIPFPTRYDSVATSSDMVHHRNASMLSFPGTGRLSINRASALELHDLIYGSSILRDGPSGDARATIERLYERDAVYSNPLLTASSGDVIKDIHSLVHAFTAFSLPTPLSLFKRMLRSKAETEWLNIARVWSEVGDVMESDVYDGHRKVIIEHTVYLLFFPDIFAPDSAPTQSDLLRFSSTSSTISSSTTTPGDTTPTSFRNLSLYSHPSQHHLHHTPQKQTISSTARALLSLCRRVTLPVHTRLMFNESGRVVHHQDVWDVKDVVRMIPGMSVMQWAGSRLLAGALSRGYGLYETIVTVAGDNGNGSKRVSGEVEDEEKLGLLEARATDESATPSAGNALGLNLSDASERAANIQSGRMRAPDIDVSAPSP